ncbi:Putative_ubiquitin fusion degradation protein [Hexamita inflata]|uniref:Putative_ubiquitin fusion degradation protein n=1 Tax=Hexamita inflata TaxID=28002 RepID=A0ABP1ISQ3_9EUKA
MSSINKHMGKPFTNKCGFPVNYSRSLKLQDNRKRRVTPQQNKDFQNSGKIIVSTEIMIILSERRIIKQGASVQFRVHNTRTNIMLMCGIDFQDIQPDQIYFPDWIHEYMDAQPDDNIFICYMELQPCVSLTLKPEIPEFFEISNKNQKLDEMMPHYSAIMQDQWIRLIIDNNYFWFQVIKCEPMYASLIDTNVTLQFESPEGLEDWEQKTDALEKLSEFGDLINKDDSNTHKEEFQIDKMVITNGQQEEGERKIFIKQMFVGKGRKL